MNFPRLQSWDRMPEESDEDFRVFSFYRDMGPDRTLDICCNALGYEPQSPEKQKVLTLSQRYFWRSRAEAFDNWLNLQHKKGMEIAAQGLGAIEANLREVHRTKEMHLVNLAFSRCRDILKAPPVMHAYNESKRGKTIVHKAVIMTPGHYLAAAQLMKIASQIGRQALRMDRDESEDLTPSQFEKILYRTQTKLARDLPQGALPAPPVQVASKPVINAAAVQDRAGGNGNGKAPTAEKFRPPRMRPGENDYNG
jgi:hypothetical protein